MRSGLLMSVGDILVVWIPTALLSAWVVIALVSLFRPDAKPPIGTFESYVARIENAGERRWGKLLLAGGMLTFTPHDSTARLTVPLSEVTSAEFPWGSLNFTIHFRPQEWQFACITRRVALSRTRDVLGADQRRARKEWLRQLKGCGVPISDASR